MSYSVNIKFLGVEADDIRTAADICRMYNPTGSYVDSAVFVKGHPIATGANYGKSVYATNVDGFGKNIVKEPYASTSIPFPVAFAQFKLAAVGENNEVTFTVEDYKEAFYYKELGEQMRDQGFEVTVTEVVPEPEESEDGDA